MSLNDLIWTRLSAEPIMQQEMARFAGQPAIFTPEAPSDTAGEWEGEARYPRTVFSVDLSENKERQCQGSVTLSLLAQDKSAFDFSAASEAVRQSLCNIMLQPGGENLYFFTWNQSKSFVVENTDICGQKLQFDLLEYSSHKTIDPDPVDAVNHWLKNLFSEALILGQDSTSQIEEISADRPILYCRLENDAVDYSTMAVTWMECILSVHIISVDPVLTRRYARTIGKKMEIEREIDMLDGSPFLVKSLAFNPLSDVFRIGQIKVTGKYGILRQGERKKR